jgi:hypothetical protein
MWGLTKNIYRFTPAMVVENLNQHTVDEVSRDLARQGIELMGLAYQLGRSSQYYQVLLQTTQESGRLVGRVEADPNPVSH